MKKIGLFLIAAMAVFAFTSCNDDTDGDYPRYTPLITTVRTIGGEEGEASADYYFQRDNGEKLYPSDKTRVPDYKGKERQRAIIWFNLLKESVPDYDYNIALYAVDEIFTGKAQVVNTAEELEALGQDGLQGQQGAVQPLERVADLLRALRRPRQQQAHVHAGRGQVGND